MAPKRPPELLTIGEACELTGFAASALRFYESIDLLEPDWVDPATGYRYFHPSKLLFLNFLKSMKENGLGLAELKPLVPVPDALALQTALAARAKAVRRQIGVLRRQLRWLTETGEKAGVDTDQPPAFVPLPERFVVETWGTYDFQGYARARHALVAQVNRLDLKWNDNFSVLLDWNGSDTSGPVRYQLEVQGPPGAGVLTLPTGTFAVERVRGPIAQVFDRTRTLLNWIRDRGRTPLGGVEWCHLVSTAHTANPDDFITEIRIAVFLDS